MVNRIVTAKMYHGPNFVIKIRIFMVNRIVTAKMYHGPNFVKISRTIAKTQQTDF